MRIPNIKIKFFLTGVAGKYVDLDKITSSLNIKPDSARTLEDWPDAIKNPKTPLPIELQSRYVWSFYIDYVESMSVNEQLEKLENSLSDKIGIINELQKEFSLTVTVEVVIQADSDNRPEMFLTNDIITFLSALNAELGFDMYID